ncbi:MAG: F0F1 ATP synthase subunit A [Planctomycetes bacterium]|nr:F0F1 ATP synthase subunit A [Planctomycetota bacterium]MBI3844740.1 F0F1 ATP synthase subunit A [Planctomycetota bacterium]
MWLRDLGALVLALAQEAEEGAHRVAEGASKLAEEAGHNPLADPIGHVHHRIDLVPLPKVGMFDFTITNTVATMWVAAGLTMLFLLVACRGTSIVPRGFRNAIEAVVVFLREDVIDQYLHGDDARRMTPFFLSVFFFVLGCNLVGLFPVPGSATPTANVNVTGAMASVTLIAIFVGGMAKQGPIAFWKNLVPHGLPFWLWPLMFVIEVVGIFAKAFALMIRLFANMTAGHLVIFVLVSLIVVFKSYLVAFASVPGAAAIYLLEIFVAFLQAYIFTFLSAVFVGAALHPEH